MTELDSVRDAYLALADCHTVTSELLRKSSKGAIFHRTTFLGRPRDEVSRLLVEAKEQLGDLAIVSLVSTFERVLFERPQSPLRRKAAREGAQGLQNVLKLFEKHVSTRLYEDVERLCRYRDWVAHGKRWDKPAHADPVSAHQRLVDFLKQAGLA